jgi:hypothetical protein
MATYRVEVVCGRAHARAEASASPAAGRWAAPSRSAQQLASELEEEMGEEDVACLPPDQPGSLWEAMLARL